MKITLIISTLLISINAFAAKYKYNCKFYTANNRPKTMHQLALIGDEAKRFEITINSATATALINSTGEGSLSIAFKSDENSSLAQTGDAAFNQHDRLTLDYIYPKLSKKNEQYRIICKRVKILN